MADVHIDEAVENRGFSALCFTLVGAHIGFVEQSIPARGSAWC